LQPSSMAYTIVLVVSGLNLEWNAQTI
jgi:hypothetical protein